MCGCENSKTDAPKSLHEKFCRITHGIPCRTVHAIMALILGRKAASDCGCGHDGDTSGGCGCGGHGKSDAAPGAGSGCGCGGHH